MHGKGRIKFLRDGIEYEGTFRKDNIDGIGIFKWRNGDSYKGQVKFGKMHGNGIYRYKDGKEYKGQFNMGYKLSDRINNYQNWKSLNYGVTPNQVINSQNLGLNEEIDVNQANSTNNIV